VEFLGTAIATPSAIVADMGVVVAACSMHPLVSSESLPN